MKPYYEHGGITIYHGDCRELPEILSVGDLCVTDPQYQFANGTKDKSSRGTRLSTNSNLHSVAFVAHDWGALTGDNEPFDPSHLLRFPKAVIFGANHFSNRLPDSRCWLIWDKREGGTPDDNADCEMAWTNLDKPARLYSALWRGLCRRGEENATSLQHPHQKPVALMIWTIKQCVLTGHELLIDPYMGSGSTLLAAKRLNIAAIGIDIEEKCCEIAAKRLSQEVFVFKEIPQ